MFVEQTPTPPHSGIEKLFSQLTASVKIDLGLEIQFLLKCLFLTVFSKIYRPTKVDVLGTWEIGILLRNLWCLFLLGYPKVTPYVPKMAAKLTSSYISSNFHKLACHLVAAFETFPVVSLT